MFSFWNKFGYDQNSVRYLLHTYVVVKVQLQLSFRKVVPSNENSKDRLPLVRNDPFFTSSHGGDKKSKTYLILCSKHSVSNCKKGCVCDIS